MRKKEANMQIHEYARPADLETAYALLLKGKTNRLLGGCTFLKRTNLKIGTAIDLQDCGLRYILECEDAVRIGAYTTLRDIETNDVILREFGTMLRDVLEHLIGVQLRNQITVGGHVAARFGFSDLIPTLLALNARVRFYHGGEKTLWAYMQEVRPEKDLLIELILPKEGRRGKVQMMRLSYNDYSIFCLVVSRSGDRWIVSAGVFPGRARLAELAMEQMNRTPIRKQDAAQLAQRITNEYRFGSNFRGSAGYRRELCRIFARRAIEELADDYTCDT